MNSSRRKIDFCKREADRGICGAIVELVKFPIGNGGRPRTRLHDFRPRGRKCEVRPRRTPGECRFRFSELTRAPAALFVCGDRNGLGRGGGIGCWKAVPAIRDLTMTGIGFFSPRKESEQQDFGSVKPLPEFIRDAEHNHLGLESFALAMLQAVEWERRSPVAGLQASRAKRGIGNDGRPEVCPSGKYVAGKIGCCRAMSFGKAPRHRPWSGSGDLRSPVFM